MNSQSPVSPTSSLPVPRPREPLFWSFQVFLRHCHLCCHTPWIPLPSTCTLYPTVSSCFGSIIRVPEQPLQSPSSSDLLLRPVFYADVCASGENMKRATGLLGCTLGGFSEELLPAPCRNPHSLPDIDSFHAEAVELGDGLRWKFESSGVRAQILYCLPILGL